MLSSVRQALKPARASCTQRHSDDDTHTHNASLSRRCVHRSQANPHLATIMHCTLTGKIFIRQYSAGKHDPKKRMAYQWKQKQEKRKADNAPTPTGITQSDASFDAINKSALAESVATMKKKTIVKEDLDEDKLRYIDLPETIAPKQLSNLLKVRTVDILKVMIKLGSPPRHSDEYTDKDLVDVIVEQFGRKARRGVRGITDIAPRREPSDEEYAAFPRRAPVVSVMGHIDHDTIRNSNVAAREHGGITQRVSAFSVPVKGHEGRLTFIDTPGHAAFLKQRERGAKITDIVVLVVAADDGVQEQTVEAIKHILEAGCSIVVALNKMDKERTINTERVKMQLLRHGIQVEDMGGDVPCVEVSGLTGYNIDLLLETILLQAEELDLRADVTGNAEGTVLDAHKREWRGFVSSIIVHHGTLKKGDAFVCGLASGVAKALTDVSTGKPIDDIRPGMVVNISGWDSLPSAGEDLIVVDSADRARNIAQLRAQQHADADAIKYYKDAATSELNEKEREVKDRIRAIELGEDPDQYVAQQQRLRDAVKVREIPVLIKADVLGSIEAIKDALAAFPADEAKFHIVRGTIGTITEQEIKEAALTEPKTIIIGFNISLPQRIRDIAKQAGVEVNSFRIIYGLVDWMRSVLGKMLRPTEKIEVLSKADVLEIFPVQQGKKVVYVAGCRISQGTFKRGKVTQVLRNDKVVFEGIVRTLKHYKQDVNSVQSGKECGIAFGDHFGEFQVGDVIQTIEKTLEERTIESPFST